MQEATDKEVLTVGVFKSMFKEMFPIMFAESIRPVLKHIDTRFEAMDRKMMDGFSMLNDKIDYVDERNSARIDELMATKADREEVLVLHRRVAKIEKKIA